MTEAAESRALIQKDRQLQEMKNKAKTKRKLLDLLSITSSEGRHKKLKPLRHAGTGNWILTTAEYQRWTELNGTSILCCYGIPGCGKTILFSRVIDHLLDLSFSGNPSVKLAFHYCDHADKRTLKPVAILGSWIRSIFESDEMPAEVMEKIIQVYKDGDQCPDSKEVLNILLATIDLFDHIVIAIDGIDEAKDNDRQAIYEIMDKIAKHHPSLRILVSCREDLGSSLFSTESTYFSLEVSETMISVDIEDYIRESINFLIDTRKIVIRRQILKEEIVVALMEGSKGMFLWVKFQLDDLCNAESDAEITSTLQNLPNDLSETYDRLLDRIVGVERQSLVKRMFQWIICARRPLTVDELCEAIAFDIDDSYWDESKIPTDIFRLIRASGNLFVVQKESREIQLAHYTIQQHILDTKNSTGKFFCFKLQEANEIVGETCAAYLNFSDFETQIVPHVDNGVTANMAAVERAVPEIGKVNLIASSSTSMAAFSLLGRVFLANSKATNIDYGRHVRWEKQPVENLLENYRLLAYVRQNWLWHTASFISKDGENPKRTLLFSQLILKKQPLFTFRPWKSEITRRDYPYLEPLGWTLVMDHCALLRVLLETDVSFKPWDYIEDAARWFFHDVETSHISCHMIQRIECCAEDTWESKTIPSQGWLYWRVMEACRKGNLNVLKLCIGELERPTINLRYDIGNYLNSHMIIMAAVHNQLSTVDFLLTNAARATLPVQFSTVDLRLTNATRASGTDFTITYNGETLNALEISAISGHLEIAIRLHKFGWQAPNFHASGRRYLSRALDSKNYEIIEAVLFVLTAEEHDYLRESERISSDALLDSASTEDLTLAKICLKYGANPLLPNSHGECAYMRAIRNENLNIVQYLTSIGYGTGSNFEGFPLSLVASTGNLEMAKTLVAYGADVVSDSGNIESLTYSSRDKDNNEHMNFEISPTPLYLAAVLGHTEMISYLLSKGARPDIISTTGICSTKFKDEPIFFNAFDGRRSIFLQHYTSDHIINVQRYLDIPNLQRPLAGAALFGHIDVVKMLLETEVPVDAEDSNGDTALLLAALMVHGAIVRLLLKAGANADTQKTRATSYMCTCVASPARVEALSSFLEILISPKHLDPEAESPVVIATRYGSLEALKLLVSPNSEMRCMVDLPGLDSKTPLEIALSRGDFATVTILVNAGAKLNAGSILGYSPLSLASLAGNIQIVNMMLAKGAMINESPRRLSPLIAACTQGHLIVVERLLSAGADPNCWAPQLYCSPVDNQVGDLLMYDDSDDLITPLMAASITGQLKTLDLLISANGDVNVKPIKGVTALMLASENGWGDIVESLIARNAEVNTRTRFRRTALMAAAKSKSSRVVSLLLAAGADINTRDLEGHTALMDAVLSNDSDDVVQNLIAADCDVHAMNMAGETSLLVATRNGAYTIVETLIAAGADVNVKNRDGNTSLFVAARDGSCMIVEKLISAGADVNAKNNDNATALVESINRNHVVVVDILIKSGAAIEALADTGGSMLQYAAAYGRHGSLRLLSDLQDNGLSARPPRLLFSSRSCGKALERTILYSAWPNNLITAYRKRGSPTSSFHGSMTSQDRKSMDPATVAFWRRTELGKTLTLLYECFRSAVLFEFHIQGALSPGEMERARGNRLRTPLSDEPIYALDFGPRMRDTIFEDVFLRPWRSEWTSMGRGELIKSY
ncbi:ankyrin repeat protein [Phlyctema vagabunda]|uniref:Ankyrin repeat protein n=1 Tax=Phlyctema vagabunda TaxID=108571 RepID=A0ABR4PCX2_9HELO